MRSQPPGPRWGLQTVPRATPRNQHPCYRPRLPARGLRVPSPPRRAAPIELHAPPCAAGGLPPPPMMGGPGAPPPVLRPPMSSMPSRLPSLRPDGTPHKDLKLYVGKIAPTVPGGVWAGQARPRSRRPIAPPAPAPEAAAAHPPRPLPCRASHTQAAGRLRRHQDMEAHGGGRWEAPGVWVLRVRTPRGHAARGEQRTAAHTGSSGARTAARWARRRRQQWPRGGQAARGVLWVRARRRGP